MKNIALTLCLLLTLFAVTATAAPEPIDAVQEYVKSSSEPTHKSVVRIYSYYDMGMLGSGWALGSGVVAGKGVYTCQHVVEGALQVFVKDWQGNTYEAKEWRQLKFQDVALVTFEETLPLKSVRVRKDQMDKGSRVLCLGFWGAGFDNGQHIRIEGYADPGADVPTSVNDLGGTWLPFAFPVSNGVSGSPIFYEGELVALVSLFPSNGIGRGYGYASLADQKTLGWT